MNLSRPRKAPGTGDTGRPLTDSSGDVARAHEERNTQQESRSKNGIPKNIRNDLEHALVGLCDVWFEDIKPHLLRNNIKLHVRGGADEAEAGGDRGRLPAGAPGCSHLDPGAASDHLRRRGANFAGFYSMLPAVSKTRSLKPPQPHFKRQSPLPPPTTMIVPRTLRNCNEPAVLKQRVQADRPRRRGGRPKGPQSAGCSAARLCRTFSTPSPLPAFSHTTFVDRPYFQEKVYNERAVHPKMKNKWTQTDAPSYRRMLPRSHAEESKKRREAKSPIAIDSRTISKSTLGQQNWSDEWGKLPIQRQVSPERPQYFSSKRRQQAGSRHEAHAPARHRKPARPHAPPLPLPRQALSPAPLIHENCLDQLCPDGLIKRLSFGAPYDMDLQILYETPRREETPENNLHKKERPPWR